MLFEVLKLGNTDEDPGAHEVIYWIAIKDEITIETKPQTPELVCLSTFLLSILYFLNITFISDLGERQNTTGQIVIKLRTWLSLEKLTKYKKQITIKSHAKTK